MRSYSLFHLTDHILLQNLVALLSRDCGTTAELLAYLAEVDQRRLYLPAGYASMYLYCVHELGMSEDVAFKRIRAARAARRFPTIFCAVADGRLHLSAVVALAPHLAPENAEELLAAATHKTLAEIELLLAQRFPQPDVPALVQAIAAPAAGDEPAMRPVEAPALQLAPGPVEASAPGQAAACGEGQLAPGPVEVPAPGQAAACGVGQLAPGPVAAPVARPKLAPLSPGRFALQLTVDQETYDQLRYAQSLLGHALPSGDVVQVFRRALDALVRELEQHKFAKSARSRPRRSAANGRYVPAEIRRAVWQRDGGRCTFVSDAGRRCEERTRLEFDHVDPVARGGRTTVDRMRLRCRAHNEYAAECAFGSEFMDRKRRGAQRAQGRVEARARAAASDAHPVTAT